MSSRYYYLTANEKDNIGWLGGNAPEWFDDKKDLVDESERHYGFYCTFQLESSTQSLSIFIPENFDYMLDNSIYPNCAVKTFVHPTTKESADNWFRLMVEKPGVNEKLTEYQKKLDYSEPVFAKTFIAINNAKNEDVNAFITVGEDVFYIQDEDFYRKKLLDDGYEIWGFINEEGYYPLVNQTDFIHGNMPLSYGAIYLYEKEKTIIVGYWQYS